MAPGSCEPEGELCPGTANRPDTEEWEKRKHYPNTWEIIDCPLDAHNLSY